MNQSDFALVYSEKSVSNLDSVVPFPLFRIDSVGWASVYVIDGALWQRLLILFDFNCSQHSGCVVRHL